MKKLLAAAFAALSIAMPVEARIDPYTDELVSAMESDGVEVAINSKRCERYDIHGSFSFRPRTDWRLLTLCPGETFDALDHSTVRHEAIHAIQYCLNKKRGTDYRTPIIDDPVRFQQEVFSELYVDEIKGIQASYSEDDWKVEYEAFLYERTMSASEIMTWYENVCGSTDYTTEPQVAGVKNLYRQVNVR
nr:hypothetical protein 3 [Pelagibacteraceae bacterium]